MKTPNLPRLLLLALLLAQLTACKTVRDPAPLADLNLLKGKWLYTPLPGFEVEFDPATRTAIFSKVPPGNAFGFIVGETSWENVLATDEKTYRGQIRYRSAAGYYFFADMSLRLLDADRVQINSATQSTSSALTISDQKTVYTRVK